MSEYRIFKSVSGYGVKAPNEHVVLDEIAKDEAEDFVRLMRRHGHHSTIEEMIRDADSKEHIPFNPSPLEAVGDSSPGCCLGSGHQ